MESSVWPELALVVTSAWPEVTGLIRLELFDQQSLRDLVSSSQLTLPAAAAGLSESVGAEWGMDNDCRVVTVTVRYIIRTDDPRAVSGGGFDAQTLLWEKADSLRAFLEGHSGAFQLAGAMPKIMVGRDEPVTKLALAEGLPLAALTVVFLALVGQSPD